MTFSRASGTLLHPTSLPGPHGIGDFGPDAYRFLDFLHAAGHKLWQVLPLSDEQSADPEKAAVVAREAHQHALNSLKQ